MKRIINGKAYNTATAQHIATADYRFDKGRVEWLGRYDLYRTKGGAFFGIDTCLPNLEYQEERDAHKWVEVKSITYDEAYEFVLGKWKWQIGEYSAKLLADGIFPSITGSVASAEK